MLSDCSPGEWRVLEVMDKRFVATPTYEGHPYFGHTRFVDIAGDEDYPAKDADMKLIAQSKKMAELLLGVWANVIPTQLEVDSVLRKAGVLK